MKRLTYIFTLLMLSICFIACGSSKKKENNSKVNSNNTPKELVTIPPFNADSAYNYIANQVAFGPRVPNSKGHQQCADYLLEQLQNLGAVTYRQNFDAIAYDGTILKCCNIIGAYKPELKKRIALFAHWDTRPWADNDKNKKNRNTPILGANDGASGVGVLLEIARNIQQQQPNLGIDIILFDAEDYGAHQDHKGDSRDEYWGLGSQYWSKYPHIDYYNARFGILLDMVGEKDARFFYEGYSKHYAKDILEKVWNYAEICGHGNYFIKRDSGYITDDHVFVNQIAKIKTIDIIPYYPTNKDSSFGSTWHTLNDNLDIINKETLKAVGETVMAVIYNEH